MIMKMQRITAVWPKVMVILLTGDNTNSVEGCLIQAFFMITLKISRNSRKKAFETCTPHLIIFINFSFVSIFFVIYVRFYPNFQHLFLSVSYNLFPPLLHPLVYGIRNKETRQSFSKIRRKVIFALGSCSGQYSMASVVLLSKTLNLMLHWSIITLANPQDPGQLPFIAADFIILYDYNVPNLHIPPRRMPPLP
ncbi:olfactory receptor 52A5-like [Alosa alosa]|uniref:olfactory receptor 52A5-like n=1 Tax=Alosa alosa TaxID=278164 RepID=UPI0020152326|nr:olfactory receptor 52A5-like [Alosa alosa]